METRVQKVRSKDDARRRMGRDSRHDSHSLTPSPSHVCPSLVPRSRRLPPSSLLPLLCSRSFHACQSSQPVPQVALSSPARLARREPTTSQNKRTFLLWVINYYHFIFSQLISSQDALLETMSCFNCLAIVSLSFFLSLSFFFKAVNKFFFLSASFFFSNRFSAVCGLTRKYLLSGFP